MLIVSVGVCYDVLDAGECCQPFWGFFSVDLVSIISGENDTNITGQLFLSKYFEQQNLAWQFFHSVLEKCDF